MPGVELDAYAPIRGDQANTRWIARLILKSQFATSSEQIIDSLQKSCPPPAYTAARRSLIVAPRTVRPSLAMGEKPQPDPLPADDPPPHPAEPLQIDTPVIDMQDLEHKPGPDTRVSNKGVRIEPTLGNETLDLAKEDEAALHAIEELEKYLKEAS